MKKRNGTKIDEVALSTPLILFPRTIQVTINNADYEWLKSAVKKKEKHPPIPYPNSVFTVEDLASFLISNFILEFLSHHGRPCKDQKFEIEF